MVGGSRIIAFGSGSEGPSPEQDSQLSAEVERRADDWPAEDAWDDEAPRKSRGSLILAGLALTAIVVWTAFFAWANWFLLAPGVAPQQAIGLVSAWSPPVLVIGILWLVALRPSTREAARFNDAGRQLREESARLEQRLATVNRELSLAREFIASQNRDLDSLGRLAAERITQHAERLDGLIKSNGAQIDAIAAVSETALDNMERLRGNLPVIVSSAKDVTNNIGNAGRSAQGQLQELISGFHKLNEFGQASERQVQSLRTRIDDAIALFAEQSKGIEATMTARFSALEQQSGKFRAQLDSHEVEALAAIRSRAAALGEELEAMRGRLDEHESESLTSLRARLSALREESTAISRALRDGESSAMTNWQAAVTRLEGDMQAFIARTEAADREAAQTAQARLAQLVEDAERFETELAARGQRFEEAVAARQARVREAEEAGARRLREGLETLDGEIAQRRVDADHANERALQAIRTQLAGFDTEVARRHEAHEAHSQRLVEHGTRIAAQLAEFAERMREVAACGETAENTIAASLQTLAARLGESQEVLSGTDAAILRLTDSSVRLLELIQASATHAKVDLPQALSAGEQRLEAAETRAFLLRDLATEAATQGDALSNHVLLTQHTLSEAMKRLDTLHGGIGEKAEVHANRLADLQSALDRLHSGSAALTEQAEGALRAAIAELLGAARDAVASIETGSAAAVAKVARQLGEDSAQVLDKVMRTRAAETAGQLEQAAAHAAGVSREAAIQLRDQLAKVNELVGNLERRVAHARERAEEKVDNDFARRSALITEALNSHAIDIAKALDSDVSDTAWAAYLKGDRGIFTRRAVRLLDTGEARSVLQLYDGDRDFRDHVSHYIHDFEAILRQMLSTRDGHALGVTLLSSDMGKLYVALAQAIERLRD
ncbi:MAG: ATPase [Novosphingobium sp.]